MVGNRVEFKLQTTVKEPVKAERVVHTLPEPDEFGTYAFHDDIDEDMLRQKFNLVEHSYSNEDN